MEYAKKNMDRLNKPFEPVTTLVIIYSGLVTISIALYALIQMYVEERELAASLLSWTATIFATIALLYIFNSWKNQKASEILSYESKLIFKFVHKNYQLFNHLFSNHEFHTKDRAYHTIRDNYQNNLENLNLYIGLIQAFKKDSVERDFKKYMEMLEILFKDQKYDSIKLNNGKDYIFTCSENLEKRIIKIILHLDNERI